MQHAGSCDPELSTRLQLLLASVASRALSFGCCSLRSAGRHRHGAFASPARYVLDVYVLPRRRRGCARGSVAGCTGWMSLPMSCGGTAAADPDAHHVCQIMMSVSAGGHHISGMPRGDPYLHYMTWHYITLHDMTYSEFWTPRGGSHQRGSPVSLINI